MLLRRKVTRHSRRLDAGNSPLLFSLMRRLSAFPSLRIFSLWATSPATVSATCSSLRGAAQTIGVPGGVTSLAAGEFGPSAQYSTVLIGVNGVGKSFS